MNIFDKRVIFLAPDAMTKRVLNEFCSATGQTSYKERHGWHYFNTDETGDVYFLRPDVLFQLKESLEYVLYFRDVNKLGEYLSLLKVSSFGLPSVEQGYVRVNSTGVYSWNPCTDDTYMKEHLNYNQYSTYKPQLVLDLDKLNLNVLRDTVTVTISNTPDDLSGNESPPKVVPKEAPKSSKVLKKNKPASGRSQYSIGFKLRAVERSNIKGVRKTARELGVGESSVHYWRRQYDEGRLSMDYAIACSRQPATVIRRPLEVARG